MLTIQSLIFDYHKKEARIDYIASTKLSFLVIIQDNGFIIQCLSHSLTANSISMEKEKKKKTSNVEKMKKNIIDRQTHPTNGTTMGTCFDFEVPFS